MMNRAKNVPDYYLYIQLDTNFFSITIFSCQKIIIDCRFLHSLLNVVDRNITNQSHTKQQRKVDFRGLILFNNFKKCKLISKFWDFHHRHSFVE